MPDSQPQPARNPDRKPDRSSGDDAAPGPSHGDGALVLCGARLADGRIVDVRLSGGRI
ncbi:hydrolase, partial [Streptomyces sp. NPDC049577]